MTKIAIGYMHGPDIVQQSDRWGQWIEKYEPAQWGWIDKELWEKCQWFQSKMPDLSKMAKLTLEANKDKFINIPNMLYDPENPIYPYSQELKKRIKWSGGTLKQLNITHPDGGDIRIVLCLGTPWFREWNLWERTVGYTLSKVKCGWYSHKHEIDR
jgi:hypothetical protein